jgi:hypothetical protein
MKQVWSGFVVSRSWNTIYLWGNRNQLL